MTAMDQPIDDVMLVAEELLRERGLLGRASIVEVAKARAAARALCDCSPSSAAAATAMLALLPGIVPESERELPLPYQDLDHAEDAREWDLMRLSAQQLDQLMNIEAVACGRATARVDERREAADALVTLLDGGAAAAGEVVALVRRLLEPAFRAEDLFRDQRAEDLAPALSAARQRIEDLTHQLARAEAQASGKLVPLDQARAQAEREAPIMHLGSGIEGWPR